MSGSWFAWAGKWVGSPGVDRIHVSLVRKLRSLFPLGLVVLHTYLKILIRK